MSNVTGLDDFPRDYLEGAPARVREAALRHGRALHALRVYRRRGWNPSAVELSAKRAYAALSQALEDWEHSEQNPRLF